MTAVTPLRTPDDRLVSKTHRYFLKDEHKEWIATVMLDARGQVFWLTNGWGAYGYRWDAAGEIRAFLVQTNVDYVIEKFATNLPGGLPACACDGTYYSPEEREAQLDQEEDGDGEDEDEPEDTPSEHMMHFLRTGVEKVLPILQAALRAELACEARALAYVAENVGVAPDAPYKAGP